MNEPTEAQAGNSQTSLPLSATVPLSRRTTLSEVRVSSAGHKTFQQPSKTPFESSSSRLESEKPSIEERSRPVTNMPKRNPEDQQANAGHATVAGITEGLAQAYAAAGAPVRNAEVSDFVKAREAKIKQDSEYLQSLPTNADRIEARRRGIGPMLPEMAMSLNPPSPADIDYARATTERILQERSEREKLAKENEEKAAKAEKERQEQEQAQRALAAAGKFFYGVWIE